ncbi:MAG: arylesterase [Anditalea sp.]
MQLKFFQYTSFAFIMLLIAFFSCGQKPDEATSAMDANDERSADKKEKKTIVIFGNSLTAGYGIEPEDAFAAILQNRIDSLELDYTIINGGLSGETTASGLNRLDWFLEEEPDIFVLELGGNDGLRGIAVSETRKNLKKIINLVQDKYPQTKIVLAGMQVPPNMGKRFSEEFKAIFPDLAEEENVYLIPFLLERVGGESSLNLSDGVHPNEEGHRIVAETVWEYLKPLL